MECSEMTYPPQLSNEKLDLLIADIKDWQINHGSLLKIVQTDAENTVLCHPVGTTLFPSLFPAELFHEALALQKTYNKLYAAVAEDEEWLEKTLKDLINIGDLPGTLWRIYQETKTEGHAQDLTLGIFRSDYMLHVDPTESSQLALKQVELNTVSCAGGIHCNRISDMHRYLLQTGAYEPNESESRNSFDITNLLLPQNQNLQTISSGLAGAHRAYGPLKGQEPKQTCVLFIVQPNNFNVADERPIEYALWAQDIPCFRVYFGYQVLSETSLGPSKELFYHPTSRSRPMEVSVVYFRSGFEEHEYSEDETGYLARLRLEKSRAIKCPSILSHLTTFKKVQQELSTPGALERFLTPEEVARVSKTFAPLYPLDDSPSGQRAKGIALDRVASRNYILKPSLEGGEHNIYGEDIGEYLKMTPRDLWHTFVLMEKITPPALKNSLMSVRGLYEGPVISELGVFGVCLWRRNGSKEGKGKQIQVEMVHDLDPCWSFKTKDASVDEMSVVKGYGCFDSPALVDAEVFASCMPNNS